MLPPAAPTTQLSTERIAVGRPITRSERRTVRPRLTTETLELVPPHSRTIPSETPSWCSAAATPAAGPEPTVKRRAAAGRPRGPSRRRRRAGRAAERRCPASRSACSTTPGGALHHRQDRGVDRGADGARLEPVGAAELVAGARRQAARRARARRRARSCLGRVDREGAADRRSPCSRAPQRRSSAASTVSASQDRRSRRGRRARCAARARARARSRRRAVRLRAGRRSGAAPMPTTPTRATSPSSSAFIACVVEKATSSTRWRSGPSARRASSQRPGDALGDAVAARRAWSGTTACARSAKGRAARPRRPW